MSVGIGNQRVAKCEITSVVTVFVTRGEKVLVLRRSEKVGSYRGRFAGVSGYLEAKSPEAQAWVELEEELGVTRADGQIRVSGEAFDVVDTGDCVWRVHPFRLTLGPDAEVRLDWEHTEMRWVVPGDIEGMDTVPGLYEAWQRVCAGFEHE